MRLHLPVLVFSDHALGLGLALGQTFLCHLRAVLQRHVQQEALVGLEELQLMSIMQALLPATQITRLSLTSGRSLLLYCS